jgi:excisionase family DNA binding protein
MKRFLVEARLTYEIEATTADDALRQVSTSIYDHNAVNVEYVVRPRLEEKLPAPKVMDSHGLDKPIYTVAEVASILGSSRGSVYELVRRGIKSIRMGRRVLVPRGTVASILNGEVGLNEPQAVPPPPPPRKPSVRSRQIQRPEVVPPVRPQRTEPQAKRKGPVSVTEAAGILHISVGRLQELLDARKVYFVQYGAKRKIPLDALENFSNGRPAIAFLHDSIAYWKEKGDWDAEMEEAAAKVLAEWPSE